MKKFQIFLDKKVKIFGFWITNFYFFIIVLLCVGLINMFLTDFEYGFDLIKTENVCGEIKKYEFIHKGNGREYHRITLEAQFGLYDFREENQWVTFNRYYFSKKNIGDNVCLIRGLPRNGNSGELLELAVNKRLIYSQDKAREFYLRNYKNTKYFSIAFLLVLFMLISMYIFNLIKNKSNN